MKNVELNIGGRTYAVACAAGEEAHVELLGNEIGERMTRIPGIESQPDQRRFLFAALLLADELYKMKQAQADASANAGTGAEASAEGDSGATTEMNEAIAAVEAIAERLEAMAERMESATDA